MSVRKTLADAGAISVFLLALLSSASPRALALPLTCKEVPGDGLTSSKPAVATALQGLTLDLFVRGQDDLIYENVWVHPDGFTGWSEIPGDKLTISEPAAVVYNGHPWVFIRGTDNRIYHNKLDGAGWSEVPGNWQTLSGPAVVLLKGNSLSLFVRGTDNRIYWKEYNGAHWSKWFDLAILENTPAVPAISEPAVVLFNGNQWVFIRGPDNRIYLNKFDNTGWSEVPGAVTVAGPSAVVENGVVKLFITSTNDGIWENDFVGNNWSGWVAVKDPAFTPLGPAAVEEFEGPPNGSSAVYVRTENEKIFECS
jgi:hypothetical protein